jgi:hypothetical protein
MEGIMHPKTKFEKLVSTVFEKSLPTIAFYTWRNYMKIARRDGWNLSDQLYLQFFRDPQSNYHAYAQQ